MPIIIYVFNTEEFVVSPGFITHFHYVVCILWGKSLNFGPSRWAYRGFASGLMVNNFELNRSG